MEMLALLQSDPEAFKDAFKLLGVGVAAGAGVIGAGAGMPRPWPCSSGRGTSVLLA